MNRILCFLIGHNYALNGRSRYLVERRCVGCGRLKYESEVNDDNESNLSPAYVGLDLADRDSRVGLDPAQIPSAR